jgi:glycosyltransferase involved in cell wall biosynthesis
MTMVRDFLRQRHRARFVRRCAAVVANSRHMARELIANGVSPDRVYTLPPPGVRPPHGVDLGSLDGTEDEYRLLFLGRLVPLKGGDLLLASLQGVRAALGRRIRVTFAGNGPARPVWEEQAKTLQSEVEGVAVEFVGWAAGERREALWKTSHLLVVPSVWPEPFGLVGLEAARYAVPAAAFDVGGIAEWLTDGVNGRLARGPHPRAGDLAEAIIACLRDDTEYRRLRRGALDSLSRFDPVRYAHSLVEIFERASSARGTVEGPSIVERACGR